MSMKPVILFLLVWLVVDILRNSSVYAETPPERLVYLNGQNYAVTVSEPRRAPCDDLHPEGCRAARTKGTAVAMVVQVSVWRVMSPELRSRVGPTFERPWTVCPDEACEIRRARDWVETALRRAPVNAGAAER